MWKEFFYFTKKERIASIALMIVVLLLILFIHIYPFTTTNKNIQLDSDKIAAYQGFRDSLKNKENTAYKSKDNVVYQPKQVAQFKRFPFDPNTADSSIFIRLGLKPYQIKNILKYREKGGVFRKQADFAKIYGISPSFYNELKPYIQLAEPVSEIADNYIPEKKLKDKIEKELSGKQQKYPLGTVIELNRADTLELQKIPGIGSVFSKRIVQFREKLGGFYAVSQLKEVYGITPEIYQNLATWFETDATKIIKLRINKMDINQLRQHPYINYYQAKAFVDIRNEKGKLHDLSQFILLDEFSEKDMERLHYYIDFQ